MVLVRSVAVMGCLVLAASAAGQTPAAPPRPPRWAVTLYGGWTAGAAPSGGSAIDPFPTGAPFTTVEGLPSRAHASWYFGDGAALFNEVATQFSRIAGRPFPQLVPLDSALRAAGSRRDAGPLYGGSVAMRVRPRLWLELRVETGPGSVPAASFIDAATRASEAFKAALADVLGTAPVTALSVTSTVVRDEASTGQVRTTLGLRWDARNRGRLAAHAALGGGLGLRTGTSPEIRLSGDYRFSLYGTSPMQEADRVVVRFDDAETTPVGYVGAGLTWELRRQWGFRIDAEILVAGNGSTTFVTATPSTTPSTLPAALPSRTTPAIQFSTQAGARSSLSGTPYTATTFEGSGVVLSPRVVAGLVVRF